VDGEHLHGKSFGRVLLTYGWTRNPVVGPYLRGKLALAGIGLHTPLSEWLDAVYAAYLDGPGEDTFKEAHRQVVVQSARLRPDRATWGLLPEHRALGQGLVNPPPRK
jgi:hypothetical protein